MAIFYMKWLKFSVVALFAAAFIGLILYVVFMQDVIRSSDVEPPLIVASDQPVKRRPDQPGGMQMPNQDKMVFDLLDTSGTEQVLPEEDNIAKLTDDEDETSAVSVTEVIVEEPSPVVAVVTVTTPVVVAKVATPVSPVAVVTTASTVKKEEPKVEEKPVTVASDGGWGVQLASVRAKADADAALKKLSNQFSVLRSLEGRVQTATVSGAASYRIQFVGSATREDAAAICKTLGAKQPCFPVKK